jgi:hypothetical protein
MDLDVAVSHIPASASPSLTSLTRERKLHVEAGEDLKFGRDAGTRRDPLRLDEEVERRPTPSLLNLARAEPERNIKTAALQVEVRGGRATQVKSLQQVINANWLRLEVISGRSASLAGKTSANR